MGSDLPLVVDLDGSLIRTDMLHELTLKTVRNNPMDCLRIPFWLRQGKAVLKRELANRACFDPSLIPYNDAVLSWLKEEYGQGRKLILCTASDVSVATTISRHLGIFEEVMASDGHINLAGKEKCDALVQRFGSAGYDYVGNSYADIEVWKHAHHAIVISASKTLVNQARACCKVSRVFPENSIDLRVWLKAIRVHQWLKNLLLFVPMLAAHQLSSLDQWQAVLQAFLSFSLCASCVYIVNDVLDLDSDRQHKRKRKRAFASGAIPIWMGLVLALVLLAMSFLLTIGMEPEFIVWLVFYFVLTFAYSIKLKRIVLLDCITLAMLYTLRIISGAAAIGIGLSFWLLAFSIFLFLSLAFVKRYAELEVKLHTEERQMHGRGYEISDAPLVQTLGVTSGFASVVVLALYLNSETIVKLYRVPEIMWGAVPIMLFWISWMWMRAHRGEMHDDPLVFAVKDKASLISGLLFMIVLAAGSVGLPW